MKMKRVYHPETKRYGFFIGKTDNYILVIPYGAAHIYEYEQILEREIARIASQLKGEEVSVYVDISPLIKKGIILKFNYNKECNSLEWFSPKELLLEELPESLRKQLKRLYERKRDLFLESMFPSEAKKFSALVSKI